MKIIATVALATLTALGASQASAQKLTFTLNWVAGGDHAPYFYAQKMGFYKQAGLDVDFETGRGSAASAQKVGAGQSQLGLSDMAGGPPVPGQGPPPRGGVEAFAQFPPGASLVQTPPTPHGQGSPRKKKGDPARAGAPPQWAG